MLLKLWPIYTFFPDYNYPFCEGATAERFGKARLAVLLMIISNLIPIVKSVLIIVYAENWWRYTVCIGREETFLYDMDDLLKDKARCSIGFNCRPPS